MASQRPVDVDQPLDLRRVVGQNIRLAQREAGMKNKVVTDALGIDVGLLVKHKGGKAMPGPETLVRYADLFNRAPAWFFEVHDDAEAAA